MHSPQASDQYPRGHPTPTTNILPAEGWELQKDTQRPWKLGGRVRDPKSKTGTWDKSCEISKFFFF